jgi:flavorubredoxin
MYETTPPSPFAPHAPAGRHEPKQIAPETFLIRQLEGEGTSPMAVYINSLVIRGAEPVLVDTGTPNNREQWLTDAFSIVEPEDVRWIFLSHDDVDHYGNLAQAMELCPNATLVTNWFSAHRLEAAMAFPLHRMRWVEDGETFRAGDRELLALRPPAFDSPTTRGLFDPTTGVYWGVDSFACPVPAPIEDVAELDTELWKMVVPSASRMMTPWLDLVDPAKFAATVDRVEQLGVSTIASCHSAVVTGANVAAAFELLRSAPTAPSIPMPTQVDLEQMIAATAVPTAA